MLAPDEAEAVLAILTKQAAAQPIAKADWRRLFTSEGYVRLKQREEVMKRSFTDDEFRVTEITRVRETTGKRGLLYTTQAAFSISRNIFNV